MGVSRHEGDFHVAGAFSAQSMSLPASAVKSSNIEPNAAIETSKQDHRHRATHSQPNTAAVAERRTLLILYGATGTVIDFRAGSIAPCIGDSTVTVDLQKNGASILTAPLTLNNTHVARQKLSAAIASATLVAGDNLEVVVTVSAGTGTLATGLFASLTLDEKAQ